MKISFIVNYIDINGGWSPWSTRVGGSEEMVIEWAKVFSRDHEVTVFHNGEHGKFGRVNYLAHEDYKPGDITINMNYPEFTPQGPTIYYSTLTNNPRLDQFDAVCGLSQYAKDNTNLPKRTVLVPPGYDSVQIYPEEKISKQCFYASSPDRGLSTLLEGWSKVIEAHPDATLLITYGADIEAPGVINLGEVDENMMNEIYRTSDIWCHPANGGELFCIAGKKAQVAGCIPVIIPTMALNETVRRGFKVESPKDYAKSLIEVLDMPVEVRNVIRKEVIKESNALTWEESAEALLEVIDKVLSK